MKPMLKRGLQLLALIAVVSITYHTWYAHFNYRFETISEDKVFKSGTIPPEKIGDYIAEHNIKTVIDLRTPGKGMQAAINAEAEAISRLQGVSHVNIRSPQVPTEGTLSQFFEVLDDQDSYPVLIHCYHGLGRAEIYSAVYRIEYENWDNHAARDAVRLVTQALGYRSSFADGKKKGEYLLNYVPRQEQPATTSIPSSQ